MKMAPNNFATHPKYGLPFFLDKQVPLQTRYNVSKINIHFEIILF